MVQVPTLITEKGGVDRCFKELALSAPSLDTFHHHFHWHISVPSSSMRIFFIFVLNILYLFLFKIGRSMPFTSGKSLEKINTIYLDISFNQT